MTAHAATPPARRAQPHPARSHRRRRRAARWVASVVALIGLCAAAAPALGQEAARARPKITLLGSGGGEAAAPAAPEGMAATVDELKLYKAAVEARTMTEAREAAETHLDAYPDSYVGHFILGYVQHYGEGNLPRSDHHFEEALELFRDQHGSGKDGPRRLWEAQIMVEWGRTLSDLGRSQEAIDLYLKHDRLFPSQLPEKISTVWPLMKLRKFDEALRVAHGVLRDPRTEAPDRAVALNGYVAVLFEKGLREEAHKWATQLTTEFPDSPTFWANAAEAARGLLRLDEGERLALESTKHGVSDYAQPYIDVADLRLRRGALEPAYKALLADRAYRRKRPPYLEQQGAASAQRTIAMMMLVVGDYEGAVNLTRRAIVQPDRSGGKSRDIRQDLATSALLDFRARLDRSHQLQEHADLLGGLRLLIRAPAYQLRGEAWASAARAESTLHDNELLIGMLRIGGPYGVACPPWLVGELIHAVGPGVFMNAVRRARELEPYKPLGAYFDAFEADAAFALGDEDDAAELAQRALDALPKDEALLRLRMEGLLARFDLEDGDIKAAIPRLNRILAQDPGLLRRLDIVLPLVEPGGDGPDAAFTDMLLQTDRFDDADLGYRVVSPSDNTLCLSAPSGARTKCTTTPRKPDADVGDHAIAHILAFHDAIFRPDANINPMALRALDGALTPSGGNRGLRDLLGPAPDPKPPKKP